MNENPRTIVILGVSGFIGSGLPALLANHGYQVWGVSRSGTGSIEGVSQWFSPTSLNLHGVHAVINLVGESIAQRWTKASMKRIQDSRILYTRNWIDHLATLPAEHRPHVWLNASAVGFYGDAGENTLDETSPAGHDTLANLCKDWEHAALAASYLGTRVICLRIALVLGKNAPAMQRLSRLFRAGLGGNLGNGQQWMPWIHVDDLRRMILHSLGDDRIHGPLNAVAPHCIRNADFTRELALAYHRPAFLHVPRCALRLALGGFSHALLSSQRVISHAWPHFEFQFSYPKLPAAIAEITSPTHP